MIRRPGRPWLVERSTRFTLLLHLPRLADYGKAPRMKNGPALAGHGAEAVRDAITRSIITLPTELRRSLTWDQGNGLASLDLLVEPQEKSLMTSLSRYPEVIELAANNRAPQTLVHYLRDLANDFHTYYNAHAFIADDANLRDARLYLISATRNVIANGLGIIGVSAPESM